MRRTFAARTGALLAIAALAACAPESQPDAVVVEVPPATEAVAGGVDPVTGLKIATDWELVRANCVACHSAKLITQQRGSAQQWLTVIRWMQAKQNLWQFEPDTEARIIAYLSTQYPPEANQRRAPIARDLMPPNPWPTVGAE